MSYQIERQLIEQAFQTGMAPDRAIQWQNSPFPDPPASGFVRLTILGGQSTLASIAADNSLKRFPGIIDVAIFVPKDKGSAAALAKVDKVAGILAHKSFQSGPVRVVTFGPQLNVIGESGDWFQVTITVPFQRDE